jgi:hypothetical protein
MEVNCAECDLEFAIKPSRLKDGYKKYCSRACAHTSSRLGTVVACHACKKDVYKSRKALLGSKSKMYFCTKSCQTHWRNKVFIGDKHANWKGGTHAYRRMMHQSDKPKVCGRCKTTDVRILAVHHVDHDRSNNTLDNLVWLCHNCHHLTHHYPDDK